MVLIVADDVVSVSMRLLCRQSLKQHTCTVSYIYQKMRQWSHKMEDKAGDGRC